MASCKYIVELTATAERTYTRLQCLAENHLAQGDTGNSQVVIFRKLEHILEHAIPKDPFGRERALSGALAHVFRMTDDPIRVYYCGSINQPKITVIHIADTVPKSGNNFRAKLMMGNSEAVLSQLRAMAASATAGHPSVKPN
jgi:hypothetical protein